VLSAARHTGAAGERVAATDIATSWIRRRHF
jgi:hypothetical protein